MDEENDYRKSLDHAISDSEGDFEKNLVYLSAGSLVLSIGFVEKVVPMENAKYLEFLIISWSFIALTLLLNLSSYLISADNSTKSRADLDNQLDYKERYDRVKMRNKKMRRVNWVSYTLFSTGIISMIIYCSINLVI